MDNRGIDDIKEARGDEALAEDLAIIADSELADWESLRGKRVLVTGATGLIGSQMILALLAANRIRDLGMTIYGVARNRSRTTQIYGPLEEREDFTILYVDIMKDTFAMDVMRQADQIDYIIHGASVTSSRTMVDSPAETIMTAITGTVNLLELAMLRQVQSFVYLSSMEVYGDMSIYGNDVTATEDRLGYIDPQRVRSNYPESKRMCENLCTAYLSEHGVPVKVARLSQTFGAGILPWENRVFSQFARSAIEGTDIVLHTKGLSEGNYCYTRDVILGLLTILMKGKDGEAYNVVNERTHMTIGEMAQLVAGTLGGGRVRVVYDIPAENTYGYAADTHLRLDGSKLRSLGWEPVVDLPQMYERMAVTICRQMQQKEMP